MPIIGVKKNPQSPMYTQLGVLTKGTIIEVNTSELGLVTTGGKVVWSKYAQVMNSPEMDGCVVSLNAMPIILQFQLMSVLFLLRMPSFWSKRGSLETAVFLAAIVPAFRVVFL